jgi:hypothetical protein
LGEQSAQVADRIELAGLLHLIKDLQRVNEAQRRRIEFLERRLEQRFVDTRQDYVSRIKYFEGMQQRVLQLFLEDVSAGVGLSMPEVLEEWARKFPAIKSANVDRRVQELARAGRLWKCKDDDGIVRFYLKLRE